LQRLDINASGSLDHGNLPSSQSTLNYNRAPSSKTSATQGRSLCMVKMHRCSHMARSLDEDMALGVRVLRNGQVEVIVAG